MNDPILVLTTGGTIEKQYFTDTIVTKLLSIARVTHPYLIEEVLRRDSIAERVTRTSFSRIVITDGTDTITRTARALTRSHAKTIVLTGALAPAHCTDSDAAFNLGMAFATAQTATAGVYIAINGSVFRGDEIVKDRERGCFVLKADSPEP